MPSSPKTPDQLDELIALSEQARATRFTGDYAPVGERVRQAGDAWEPAIRQLLGSQRTEDAMRVVAGLSSFWLDTGRVGEGRAITEEVLSRVYGKGSDPTLQARTLLAAGELAFSAGDRDGAEAHSAAALETAADAGDAVTGAMAEVNLARVAFRDGSASSIEAHARRALDLAERDPLVQRGAFHMLGWAAHTAGDRQAAIDWMERSMEVRAALGDEFGVAVELANLGDLAVEHGDIARAASYLRRSLLTARRLDNVYLVTANLASTGTLAGDAGRWEECLVLIAASNAAYAATSLIPDPGAQEATNAATDRARENVTAEQAADALAAGGSMSLEQAITRAVGLCEALESGRAKAGG